MGAGWSSVITVWVFFSRKHKDKHKIHIFLHTPSEVQESNPDYGECFAEFPKRD